MRSGQITIFFLLGIVIIITIGFLYFTLKTKSSPDIELIDNSVDLISAYVDSCANIVFPESTRYVASSTFFSYTIPQYFFGTPYLYYQGVSFLPSKSDFEKRYSQYLTIKMDLCVKKFSEISDFLPANLILEGNYLLTEVVVAENSITGVITINVFLNKTNEIIKIPDTTIRINSKLGNLYEVSRLSLVPSVFCISCVKDYLHQHDLFGRVSLANTDGDLEFLYGDYSPSDKGFPLVVNFYVKP
ncbi:MAG: hypothetical protein KJ583_04460 [Nanoarchaeota archaeon]|nr:hypothetical protein [Nanoarchaeota archaeon]MBU1270109.1 hypothetical protein [Nanoarchaeota archaeon]MBU1604544.1 hypothetical protein [Nanoarchaeota archaeon]MBU2442593.1 hypothetical protein [Nanoarchaeota archaeon]